MFRTHGLISIHLAVLLFGVSGLFGKLLSLPPSLIVFCRTLFASIALILVLPILKIRIRINSGKNLLGFLLMGAILAVHWVAFFHSIQISTAVLHVLK